MQDYEGKWLKRPQVVLFEVLEGNVARITMNRPESRNALSTQLLLELRDALLEADDREDVHAVLLQGEGKDFCAGYDLIASYGKAEDTAGNDIPYRVSTANFDNDCWSMERFQSLPDIIYDMHKPVIAKIHGNCLAGGTDIAFR